jgi:hypothetical protein
VADMVIDNSATLSCSYFVREASRERDLRVEEIVCLA